MDTVSKPDTEAIERLRREFPGHHIWRSRRWDGLPGEYMATLVDPSAGVDATVMQPGPEELRAELLREAARAQGRGKDFR